MREKTGGCVIVGAAKEPTVGLICGTIKSEDNLLMDGVSFTRRNI